MATTVIRGAQILNNTVQRQDLDTGTVGQAVVTKLVQGSGIVLSSTGADSGTGDVTVSGGTPIAHEASHVTGSDQIPNASATARGLLNQVSGLSTDYVGGDNQCHPMPVSGATLQTAAANPTGTTSTTGVMAGLGGNITPVRNGKIAVTICGFGASSAVGGAFQVVIRYGTGTAPANGAAAVGTAIGGTARGQSYAANGYTSFSVSAVITGLTLGTPVWIDLLQQSVIVAGTASLITTAISAFELP